MQRYADILDEMVAGLVAYADDVRTHRYPRPDHGYSIPDEELAAFKAALQSDTQRGRTEAGSGPPARPRAYRKL